MSSTRAISLEGSGGKGGFAARSPMSPIGDAVATAPAPPGTNVPQNATGAFRNRACPREPAMAASDDARSSDGMLGQTKTEGDRSGCVPPSATMVVVTSEIDTNNRGGTIKRTCWKGEQP